MLGSISTHLNTSSRTNTSNASKETKVARINVLEEITTSVAQIVFAAGLGALTAWTFSVMPVLGGAVVMASFVVTAMIAKLACKLLGISNEVIKGAVGGIAGVLGANLIALKVFPYLGMVVSVPTVTTFIACHLVVGLALVWLFTDRSSSANTSSRSNLNNRYSIHPNSVESTVNQTSHLLLAAENQALLTEVRNIPRVRADEDCMRGLNLLVQQNHPEANEILRFLINTNLRQDNADLSLMMGDVKEGYSVGFPGTWRAQWGRYDH